MPTQRRRQKPELPRFVALDQLQPGKPFNPYRLYEAWSVRQAISRERKLRPGAKLVWLMLADQVFNLGYDYHSQASLAGLVGLSLDQFWRHLQHLKKSRLIHIEHELGRQNYTWLLYQPLFSFCSPRTPRKSAVGGTAEMQEGLSQNRSTQRKDQRKDHKTGSLGIYTATSYRGSPEANGRKAGEDADLGEDQAEVPITNRLSTLAVQPAARSFWYSLSPIEKRNRQARASALVEQAAYFRQHLNDAEPNIQRQARHELNRRLAELSQLGFFLQPNPKGQP